MKPGQYKAKAVQSALCASATKGTEFVAIVFEVTEGADAGERIRADLYWTEKTEDRVLKALKLMGWDGGVGRDMALVGLTKPVPIGVVEKTRDNGRTDLVVDWIGEPPFGGIDDRLRLDATQARSFVLALRSKAGIAPKNGTRPAAAPPPREPGDDSDEVDF